jgi:hypothetical protein
VPPARRVTVVLVAVTRTNGPAGKTRLIVVLPTVKDSLTAAWIVLMAMVKVVLNAK